MHSCYLKFVLINVDSTNATLDCYLGILKIKILTGVETFNDGGCIDKVPFAYRARHMWIHICYLQPARRHTAPRPTVFLCPQTCKVKKNHLNIAKRFHKRLLIWGFYIFFFFWNRKLVDLKEKLVTLITKFDVYNLYHLYRTHLGSNHNHTLKKNCLIY